MRILRALPTLTKELVHRTASAYNVCLDGLEEVNKQLEEKHRQQQSELRSLKIVLLLEERRQDPSVPKKRRDPSKVPSRYARLAIPRGVYLDKYIDPVKQHNRNYPELARLIELRKKYP